MWIKKILKSSVYIITLFVPFFSYAQIERVNVWVNNEKADSFIQADGETKLISKKEFFRTTPDWQCAAFVSNATNLIDSSYFASNQFLEINAELGEKGKIYDNIFVRNTVTKKTELVTQNNKGESSLTANTPSIIAISNDCRYVYFMSDGKYTGGEKENDGNWVIDIYVRDLIDQKTTLVSSDIDGNVGNAESYWQLSEPWQSISIDGQTIVFSSVADNLVPNDTNSIPDIFIKNIVTQEIRRVNISDGIEANWVSKFIKITPDWKYVLFSSEADNLVPNDTNGVQDVFVRDILNWITTRVSVFKEWGEFKDWSQWYDISDDGNYVLFSDSNTTRLSVRDITHNDTINIIYYWRGGVISAWNGGVISALNRGVVSDWKPLYDMWYLSWPRIYNNQFVFFGSIKSNIVPEDTNESYDIFRKDIMTQEVIRINTVDKNLLETHRDSQIVAITPDGNSILFSSDATNLIKSDEIGQKNLFVTDISAWTINHITATTDWRPIDGIVYPWIEIAKISDDGRYVYFWTQATDFLEERSWEWNLYKRDTKNNYTTLISTNSLWWYIPDQSYIIDNYALYISTLWDKAFFMANDWILVEWDNNRFSDIFMSQSDVDDNHVPVPIIEKPVTGDEYYINSSDDITISWYGEPWYLLKITVQWEGFPEVSYTLTVPTDRLWTQYISLPMGSYTLSVKQKIEEKETQKMNMWSNSAHTSFLVWIRAEVSITTPIPNTEYTGWTGILVTWLWQPWAQINGTLIKWVEHMQRFGVTVNDMWIWTYNFVFIPDGVYTMIAEQQVLWNITTKSTSTFSVQTPALKILPSWWWYGWGNGWWGKWPVVVIPVDKTPIPLKPPVKDTPKDTVDLPVITTSPLDAPKATESITPTIGSNPVKEAIVQTSSVWVWTTVEIKTPVNPVLESEKKCYTPKEIVNITLWKNTTNKDQMVYQALLKSYDLTIFSDTDLYRPNSRLTRNEAAKMFVNFAKYVLCREKVKEYNDTIYTDIVWTDETLLPYIKQAYEYGILKWSNSKFRPTEEINRKEFVAGIMRMFTNENLDVENVGNEWDQEYVRLFKSYELDKIVWEKEEIWRYEMSKIMYTLYYNTWYEWTDKGYVLPTGGTSY
jgi:hypothetical protein